MAGVVVGREGLGGTLQNMEHRRAMTCHDMGNEYKRRRRSWKRSAWRHRQGSGHTALCVGLGPG